MNKNTAGFRLSVNKTLNRLKVFFLYHFKLRPRIIHMKRFVRKIAGIKHDLFPRGKSLFVFAGKDDNLYFIILKEEAIITVTEVYDDILHKIPEKYQLLPKIRFNSVFMAGVK